MSGRKQTVGRAVRAVLLLGLLVMMVGTQSDCFSLSSLFGSADSDTLKPFTVTTGWETSMAPGQQGEPVALVAYVQGGMMPVSVVFQADDGWTSQTLYPDPFTGIAATTHIFTTAIAHEVHVLATDGYGRSASTEMYVDVQGSGTGLCTDTCQFAQDDVCDDGGSGSQYSVCDYGTDCSDCGPR